MSHQPLHSSGRNSHPGFRRPGHIRRRVSSLARGIGVLGLGLVLFTAGGSKAAAEEGERPDQATVYAFRWLEVTAAIGDISRITLKFDPKNREEKLVAELKEATDRLETASNELMRAVPPVDNSRLHVIALPRLIEIVGAARKALHELAGVDDAEFEASLKWLDNALLQLQKAVRAALPPAAKSAPDRKQN